MMVALRPSKEGRIGRTQRNGAWWILFLLSVLYREADANVISQLKSCGTCALAYPSQDRGPGGRSHAKQMVKD